MNVLGKIKTLRRQLSYAYLINVKHVPEDSRKVGGSVIYAKPGGRVIIAKGGSA